MSTTTSTPATYMLQDLEVSGNINLDTGNSYKINGTSVLSSTTLGQNVVTSSLNTVGTLSSLSVTGLIQSSTVSLYELSVSSTSVSYNTRTILDFTSPTTSSSSTVGFTYDSTNKRIYNSSGRSIVVLVVPYVQFASNSNNLRRVFINKNSSLDHSYVTVNAVSGGTTNITFMSIIQMSSGDYISLQVAQNSASGTSLTATGSISLHILN